MRQVRRARTPVHLRGDPLASTGIPVFSPLAQRVRCETPRLARECNTDNVIAHTGINYHQLPRARAHRSALKSIFEFFRQTFRGELSSGTRLSALTPHSQHAIARYTPAALEREPRLDVDLFVILRWNISLLQET